MNKTQGITLVLLTAFVSGFSIFINKFGVSGINSDVFTFAKNAVVALLLYSFIVFAGERAHFKRLSRCDWLALAVIGFVGGSIPFLLFFKGLSLTSAAKAAFIHKTMFVYVIVLASLFLKEKINVKTVTAAGLLLAGNALLLGIMPKTLTYGDYLILVATLLWACENTLSKYVLNTIPSRLVAFGRMFFGSMFILSYLLWTKQASSLLLLSKAQFGWILVSSGFLFLYVFFWYAGLKHVNVVTATSILLLGSPITTLLSLVFSGTTVTLSNALGILLTLVGVLAMIGACEQFSFFFTGNARRWFSSFM